ncbi:hypothetical protein IFT73_17595 [Aeromicrobium sp. CFBP 8757]|uniref:hypothetical protein n=1 Tax=Aeromicrobium sp. CFBP 8757 TaxID=2775288 RepID=UPI001784161A|nr:hypothetical protein [Aeromicrobium sp. CFBP 8757]MBD8608672.1 hypothetical protein [Aeromicrobium sp. CFBP 8757]
MDYTTALAIVRISGTSNLVIGALVSALPSLIAGALYFLVGNYYSWFRARTGLERSAIQAAAAPIFILALAAAPVAVVVIPALVLMLIALGVRLWGRLSKKSPAPLQPDERPSDVERNAVRAIIGVGILFQLISAPWLPSERVESPGIPARTVQVLGFQGASTAVLVIGEGTANRRIEMLPTQETTRVLCSRKTWMDKTLSDWISGDRYPRCPD